MKMNGIRSLTVADAVEINLPVMISAARSRQFREQLQRKTHDFTAIADRHLGVMRALLVSTRVDFKTTATVLKYRVMLQNDVTGNMAREHIYEVESMGLIGICRADPDEGDRRENIWRFRDGVQEQYEGYCQLALQIAQVAAAQLAQPMNAQAGRDLVPGDVYFNILDAENHAAAREALKDLQNKDQKRRKSGKKGDQA